MSSIRNKFNTKRRIAVIPPKDNVLEDLAESVSYGGNPTHKRNPGDFGLTPPSLPRSDKSLCDNVQITKRAEALNLLKKGIRKGMVSEGWEGKGFPKNIWVVTDEGVPLEAILENPAKGTYHGYPLELNDDFRDEVLRVWRER